MSGSSEVRRLQLLDMIRERLAKLDPIFGGMSGVQITIRLRPNGTPRSVVVEAEMRTEVDEGGENHQRA